jgi:transcriptional regulator with XRE-family HTH domain
MYSYEVNKDQLDKANSALAIIEQVEIIYEHLKELEEVVSLQHKAEVAMLCARAEALLKVLNEQDEEVLEFIKDNKNVTSLGGNKIEKLGIGSEIIRLRSEAKMSYQDIAKRFQISASTVSAFCKLYDKSNALEQSKVRSSSIMDFERTWEDIGATIYRMLAKLEHDPEHHVKYISELRQLSAIIEKFQNKRTAQQQIQQIIQINKEILIDVIPEKRALIAQRFEEVGLGRMLQPDGLALRR